VLTLAQQCLAFPRQRFALSGRVSTSALGQTRTSVDVCDTTVSAKSTLEKAEDADRPGVRIAVVRAHASTIALERMVKQAQLVYADTYDPTFELLRSGNVEAFASIREILVQYSSQFSGSRVLKDSYLTNLAGIAVPKGNAGRLSFVTEFLSGMKRSGAMQRLVNEAGLRGVEVAEEK